MGKDKAARAVWSTSIGNWYDTSKTKRLRFPFECWNYQEGGKNENYSMLTLNFQNFTASRPVPQKRQGHMVYTKRIKMCGAVRMERQTLLV